MKKTLPLAIIATFVLGSFTSCHDSEVENVQQAAYLHSYESGFVKTFGEVSPNQTWDFTSYARHQRLINQNLTRDMTEYQSVASADGWYYVENDTENWLDENLAEGVNHKGTIKSFVLRTEESRTVFEIVPFYQGTAALIWSLSISLLKDGETTPQDIRVWEKSQGIEVSEDGITWKKIDQTTQGGRTDHHAHVRATPILFEVEPFTTINFYITLIGVNGNEGVYGHTGDILRSTSDPTQIAALQCPLPGNIHSLNEGYHSYILGVEDNADQGSTKSDWDYNDVVFLLTGYAPEVIYNEEPRTTYIYKRYMIEDLGDTYDYDFNDIVVDVTQKTTTIWVIDTETHEATPKEGVVPEIEQWATVQLLCGILPIQIQVGDTYFGQVTDPTAGTTAVINQLNRENPDTNYGGPTCPGGTAANRIEPGVIKTVTGWNPDTNNVTAYVWKLEDASVAPSASTTGIWTATFPGTGAIPYIIAVDQDVDPMPERMPIPEDWMAVVP